MPRVTRRVELIRYTEKPEEAVALAAKLCYSDADLSSLMEELSKKDTAAFIKKLIDMGHLSPIEHASFSFAIEGVSRALLAQITRHRIASFSVKSQRYVRARGGFNYIIPPAIEALGEGAVREFEAQMDTIYSFYEGWLGRLEEGEKGNEDARFVLPNAAESKMIVTMNARELLHFFFLRCCNRAQWEIRAVAWDMLKLAAGVAPALFCTAGPSCVRGKCSEGKMSCGKMDEVKKRHSELTSIYRE
ncbi:MAG: FAD-dependent thymidylate synthase [Clostridiales bacterium]|jgi:thymidylate synthase (FAD)|nr:FAD-dependent thymidylate synthase [Clostridiales bacterium]